MLKNNKTKLFFNNFFQALQYLLNKKKHITFITVSEDRLPSTGEHVKCGKPERSPT